MAKQNKTTWTDVDPKAYITAIEHPARQQDAEVLVKLMSEVSGEEARMWGPSIVGFGDHHYIHSSGREGDTPVIGFSPRKASLVLYGLNSAPGSAELLARLGKHRLGASCLYINKLADVDQGVLRQLAELGYEYWSSTSDSFVAR